MRGNVRLEFKLSSDKLLRESRGIPLEQKPPTCCLPLSGFFCCCCVCRDASRAAQDGRTRVLSFLIDRGPSRQHEEQVVTCLQRDATSPAPESCKSAKTLFFTSPIFFPCLRVGPLPTKRARAADELSAWDGFSSAESETLAPEQSSFCRVARGSVAILDMTIPPLPAYCPYYRAYLLQKEPKNWWHWRPSNKAKEDKDVYQRP